MGNLQQHEGFNRTFQEHKLTLGLAFPLEAYEGNFAQMDLTEQITLAQRAEELNFAALFIRDTPLFDEHFSDAGAMYDPWVFLSYIAAKTQKIALGAASIITTLRHPLHLAKSAASLDKISNNRFLFGAATGDRKIEFPAFKVDYEKRSELFRESLEVMREAWNQNMQPIHTARVTMQEGNLYPKPNHGTIPVLGTGYSGQTLEWLADNMDGWLFYPQNINSQRELVAKWHATTPHFKPFGQMLMLDLSDRPNEAPKQIERGIRTGRTFLIDYLYAMQDIGVNHITLALKNSKRPVSEVIEELGQYVVPKFKAHK
ncbi:LLM class oxidoreductase [Kurthia sibirica]|uniref:LLM class flavin-dependent oxidoreductase n=1 Tax=Kurthia sibirica TaxID=202750 RepID=A0A2U3AJR1_9BACL|nr:LLM class oxidoreductase [Kurthia sibirica]PWI24721.1 LLM class flavin-dependent oxidoreductase [Kurthia sibirica]GEK34750.1 luciferase [Kurthia sibirica]